MGTVKACIEDALKSLVVLSEGEEATAAMIEDGKRKLLSMISLWSIEGLMVPYQTTETFVLSPTTAAYLWGVGQSAPNFNSLAPTRIDAASFIVDNVQRPLIEGDARQFAQVPLLGNVSQPSLFFYDRQAIPVFRLDCLPYGGSVKIVSRKPFSVAYDLTDELTFPPEYDIPLWSSLAILLAPDYEKTPSQTLAYIAKTSKQTVESFNAQPVPTLRHNVPQMRTPASIMVR